MKRPGLFSCGHVHPPAHLHKKLNPVLPLSLPLFTIAPVKSTSPPPVPPGDAWISAAAQRSAGLLLLLDVGTPCLPTLGR